MKCLICNKEFSTHQSFCAHLKTHKISIKNYIKTILKMPYTCKMCGKETTYNTKNRSFNKYCSAKCAGMSPETKIKRENTCMKKFGVRNASLSEEKTKKYKKTCLKKYGVENVFNIPEIRALTTKIVSENKKELLEKREKTNLEKYGVTCTLNTQKSIEKKKKTWKHNYGTDHPLQSENIKEKIKQTCLKKYGVASPLQSKDIYNKVIQTNIEKYGVSNPTQNSEILHKTLGSLFRRKPYTLPSGRIVHLLGYEPYFLDFVFNNKLLDENDINYSPDRIEYIGYDNQKHYYFPDFYIPKMNLIIEIKSKWTVKQDKNIILKEQACKDGGFNYIQIINNDFNKFIEYIKINLCCFIV